MSVVFGNLARLSEWSNLCKQSWIVQVSLKPSCSYLQLTLLNFLEKLSLYVLFSYVFVMTISLLLLHSTQNIRALYCVNFYQAQQKQFSFIYLAPNYNKCHLKALKMTFGLNWISNWSNSSQLEFNSL